MPDLVHVVLRNRPSRVVRQELPSDQKETENIIARKFVRVLNERFERKCSEPTLNINSEFPDCYCTEDGQSVGIELEEVTGGADAEHYQKAHSYSRAIIQELSDDLASLQGLHIAIFLADTNQELPSVKSNEGRQLPCSLAKSLLSRLSELQRLQRSRQLKINWEGQTSHMSRSLRERFLSALQDHKLKQQLEVTWKKQTHHPLYLTMVARRYEPSSSASAPLLVEFGPRGESPEIIRDKLKEAVRRKIGKQYRPGSSQKLLLLLYERFWISRFGDKEAVRLAQNELKVSKHPFDEVWYFYPIAEDHQTPEKPEGFLKRLWPTEKD